MQSKNAIVALSGGMDSATVLAEAINQKRTVLLAVSFRYGSKHNQYENNAAKQICQHYAIRHHLMDLSNVFRIAAEESKSALFRDGDEIPEGHYEAASMEKTVVPARNIIFASILTSIAWSLEAYEVWMGMHSGDHAIYPDCRPEFVTNMRQAMFNGTAGRVMLKVPFLGGDKESILHQGFSLSVPYQLTRTCYKDQPVACGKCGACQERLAAFAAHNAKDPIPYESQEILPKPMES